MDCIISYNTYRKKANKYLINIYTKSGKRITMNKLIRRIKDYENKKHKLSPKQKLYNNIVKFLSGDLTDNDLDKAIHYFIRN